ncbi:protein required for normal CLN1 and CLN2 G1 cyclin expression [Coemansia erecta]|uniref:Protein required for normal CLN1 and CLN2 G1 cyclin expression n=1 Tax=Coemansia erecta TaxID=147472 RepID=A0A9W7XXZ4_9FUNG|nr:protein required for normal CLN1 and CLN2 G1 cyclin expression [Coemansia erecta]
MASRVIEVPIYNSNDVLEIDCSQLPAHASELCDILENEGSALRLYQEFALEYYKQGSMDEAVAALKRGVANAKANDQTAKVPLLSLLASMYVQKAKATEGGSSERELALQMATTLLNEAERISRSDGKTQVVRGMLALARRQPDAALRHFQQAQAQAPGGGVRGVAALLGAARVLYGRQQYAQALAAYQQALVLRPGARPDPRIGIGMCLERLGYADDARRALARAAAVDPQAAAPRILLATMDLNAAKRAAAAGPAQAAEAAALLRAGMAHLRAAYALQPDNAAVLLRLADRLAWRGDWAAARRLAERALRAADTMALQAEAQYQLARAHHGGRRFDAAHDAYARAVAINERHVLARFGLAQTLLQRADMSGAEAALQRVLDRHPRCSEALRALGYLHARLPNTKAKALEYYERAMAELNGAGAGAGAAAGAAGAAADAADADLFLEAAQLYEPTAARRAARAYRTAAALLDAAGRPPPPELWSNVGALAHVAGDALAAEHAAYTRAAAALADAPADAPTRVTLAYNVARFYERSGQWRRAAPLYRRVLARAPAYADALLRLAHIALAQRGAPADALALVAQAVALDARRAAAWLLRGRIELLTRDVQNARRAFEHVLRDIAKHDVYALCALGNYYLAAARADSDAAASHRRALEFFDKCLAVDASCAAAAHGAAIAMAERGFAVDARRLFHDVRDAATAGLGPPMLAAPADLVYRHAPPADAPHCAAVPPAADVILWASVNAAHALVDEANYRQAILAYEACLRRLRDAATALAAEPPVADLAVPDVLARDADDAEEDAAADAAAGPPDAAQAIADADREIRLYLVRAMYVHAKAQKDAATMRAALDEMRSLCAAIDYTLPAPDADADADASADPASEAEAEPSLALTADQGLLLFDLALLEQSVAQLTSEQPESERTLASVDAAAQALSHSTRLFTLLATWGRAQLLLQQKQKLKKLKLLFSPRLAAERAAYGRSLTAKLARRRDEQEAFEQQRQASRDTWLRQQQDEERVREEQRKALDDARRIEEERLLRETEEKNRALREQLASEHEALANAAAAAEPSSHGAKRKTAARAVDNHDDDAMTSTNSKKYKSKAIVSESESEDDDDDNMDGGASAGNRTPSPSGTPPPAESDNDSGKNEDN